jgi:hypothetical protein
MCGNPSDVMQQAHIDRYNMELRHYCQHPHNLMLMCRECHGRYDDGLIRNEVVRHAKNQALARLMEDVDRDIALEEVMRRVERHAEDRIGQILKVATGSAVSPASGPYGDFMALLGAAAEIGERSPWTAASLYSLAIEPGEEPNSWAALDRVLEPLPVDQAEFDDAFPSHKDDDEPDRQLYAWAIAADTTFGCGICDALCVDVPAFASALAEHWAERRREMAQSGDSGEEGQSESDLWQAEYEHVMSMVSNCGIETGGFDGGYCAYHENVMGKD